MTQTNPLMKVTTNNLSYWSFFLKFLSQYLTFFQASPTNAIKFRYNESLDKNNKRPGNKHNDRCTTHHGVPKSTPCHDSFRLSRRRNHANLRCSL